MTQRKLKICPSKFRSILSAFFLLLFITSCAHRSERSVRLIKIQVKDGDSLNSLAAQFNVDRMDIVRNNPQIAPRGLRIGEFIYLPLSGLSAEVAKNSNTQGGNSTIRLMQPVKGRYTSMFGHRNGRPHHGVDIAAKKGTHVMAAAYGVVEFAGWQRGYGHTVIVNHENGRFKTLYAHLNAIHVKVGESLKVGHRLGDVGATGRATGPHLHFELRDKRDIPVNPISYITPKDDKSNKMFLFSSSF